MQCLKLSAELHLSRARRIISVCFLVYTALYKYKHNIYLGSEEQHDIVDSCEACDLPQPTAFFTADLLVSHLCAYRENLALFLTIISSFSQ